MTLYTQKNPQKMIANDNNYFVIGIYIPQKKRQNPNQMNVYDELEALLQKVKRHDCVFIMGDFNSRVFPQFRQMGGDFLYLKIRKSLFCSLKPLLKGEK